MWLNITWLQHKYALCCCPWYHREGTWLEGKGYLELRMELMEHRKTPIAWDWVFSKGGGRVINLKKSFNTITLKKGQINMEFNLHFKTLHGSHLQVQVLHYWYFKSCQQFHPRADCKMLCGTWEQFFTYKEVSSDLFNSKLLHLKQRNYTISQLWWSIN